MVLLGPSAVSWTDQRGVVTRTLSQRRALVLLLMKRMMADLKRLKSG